MAVPFRRFGNDRGAILVHVAFALLALMAFSAFTIDYGILWASRRQAQNSADAAALAGAAAFVADPSRDTSDAGSAKQNALAMSQANVVWGQAPTVALSDITFPTAPPQCPATPAGDCIRVDVFRTVARGSGLPVVFGTFVGLTNNDIRATATAKTVTANSSNCMKPWALPDLFTDVNGNGEYDAGDVYDPGDPNASPIDFGTGYSTNPATSSPPGNYGTRIRLKSGPHGGHLEPGWFMALDFGSGANTYRDAISGCVGTSYGIGDVVPEENGNMQGPTQQGVDNLIDLDPDAYWDKDLQKIMDSCVDDGSCPGYTVSPRVVPIPVFSPEYYAAHSSVLITKILGFFVEDLDDVSPSDYPPDFDDKFDVLGVLINVPAMWDGTKGTAGAGTFAQSTILIR